MLWLQRVVNCAMSCCTIVCMSAAAASAGLIQHWVDLGTVMCLLLTVAQMLESSSVIFIVSLYWRWVLVVPARASVKQGLPRSTRNCNPQLIRSESGTHTGRTDVFETCFSWSVLYIKELAARVYVDHNQSTAWTAPGQLPGW